jgi:hypothetical protein
MVPDYGQSCDRYRFNLNLMVLLATSAISTSFNIFILGFSIFVFKKTHLI